MLMLDLQKAFDTVDHDILCKKQKAVVVKSVEGFRSYLAHRKVVHVNNTESDPVLVTCGVPQGSILGPLLFLCYINDMQLSISKESKLLFMRTTVPYCTHTRILGSYLKNLAQNWRCVANGLLIINFLCIWEKLNAYSLDLRENSERLVIFRLNAMVIR